MGLTIARELHPEFQMLVLTVVLVRKGLFIVRFYNIRDKIYVIQNGFISLTMHPFL